MSKIKVLIFDLDLTLCENYERKRKAIERALNKEIPRELVPYIRSDYVFDTILAKMGIRTGKVSILKSAFQHFFYDEDLFQLDKPFKGAVETLTRLAEDGYRIYYLTGRPIKKTAIDFITKYGFPQGTTYAEKVGVGESHKKVKLFSRILKDAGVEPSEAAAIGDLPGDASAAEKVGIIAIGTYEGHPSGREGLEEVCDLVIERIVDLPEALHQVDSIVSNQVERYRTANYSNSNVPLE